MSEQSPPASAPLLPGYLSYSREGDLLIYGMPAVSVVQSTTPALVYCEERLQSNVDTIRRVLDDAWPLSTIKFALKSCYIKPVVESLFAAGCGLEVMSEVEFAIARQCGVPPEEVIATGLGRSDRFVEELVAFPPGLTVVDNIDDVDKLADSGFAGAIGIRVALCDADVPWYAGSSSKVGARYPDEFVPVIEHAIRRKLNVTAIHCHAVGRCRHIETYRLYAERLAEVVKQIHDRLGFSFQEVDIGGGFDTRMLMEREGVFVGDLIGVACSALRQVPYDFKLTIEPGRYLVADAAICLTKIVMRRDRGDAIDVIVDATTNFLIPRPNMEYPFIAVEGVGADLVHCRVGDRTCVPGFLWTGPISGEVDPGKWLGILNCGAYTSVYGELWAFELPSIAWLSETGEAKEILGRKSQEALWRAAYSYNPL